LRRRTIVLPGNAKDERKNAKIPRPPCAIKGWSAAWMILERVERDDHREILSCLVRASGFQGAPALKYMAQCLCCEAGLRLRESPPDKLTTDLVSLISERARTELDPYRELFELASRKRVVGAQPRWTEAFSSRDA
jgi:hypothetical protein